MTEEVWQHIHFTGPRDRPAFYFWLDLLNLPIESTLRVHNQAIEGLMLLGHGPRGETRPLVRNALQAIAHLTEVRLAHDSGWAPATQYWVQAAIEPLDSDDDVVEGDRARLITWASELADQDDTAAGYVWGAVTEGMREDPRAEPPDAPPKRRGP